jgi:hypothetical protein
MLDRLFSSHPNGELHSAILQCCDQIAALLVHFCGPDINAQLALLPIQRLGHTYREHSHLTPNLLPLEIGNLGANCINIFAPLAEGAVSYAEAVFLAVHDSPMYEL